MRNSKAVRNTGLSFAIVGTGMHFLNIASATTPQISHTWSAIAIAGFFLTSISQLKESNFARLAGRKGARAQVRNNMGYQRAKNDDISLP